MKKFVRLFICMLIFAGWLGRSFAQEVKDVAARQRYPWNNLVDIDYTVEGVTNSQCYFIRISATDKLRGTTYPVNVPGISAENGSHHVTWDPVLDGIELNSSNVVCSVVLCKCPYVVIDLSDGLAPGEERVKYLPDVPEGGWKDEHKSTKLVLRRIPRGTFMMGSPADEPWRHSFENQHKVTLEEEYFMGVFEVTKEQWNMVESGWSPAYSGEFRPMDRVSYEEIRGSVLGVRWPGARHVVDEYSFLCPLRARTGISSMDLPTEAEWEYACRAGTTSAWNSGKGITGMNKCANLEEVGRYQDNRDDSRGGGYGEHTAVGSYAPNAWGLYDMHGNVAEWCLDSWNGMDDYDAGEATDPHGPDSPNAVRVLRGGHWSSNAEDCRSAARFSTFSSEEGEGHYGLRLSCRLPQLQGSTESGDARFIVSRVSSPSIRVTDVRGVVRRIAPGQSVDLTYSDSWDGVAGGEITISVNGEELFTRTEKGVLTWKAPDRIGPVTFVHAEGDAVESATFEVWGPIALKDVKARQRYPWNNLIDIDYTVEGVANPASYYIRILAKDLDSGKTYDVGVPDAPAGDGCHRVTWNPEQAGLSFTSSNVVFSVSLCNCRYKVVDLVDGAVAPYGPVSYLEDIPAGGWTKEYKTTKLVMRRIPAGSFMMGSPTNELGRQKGEARHRVTLTDDYYMGVFEITQDQWERIMGGNNPSAYKGKLRPVDHVSYDMIRGAFAGSRWPAKSMNDPGSFLDRIRFKTGPIDFDLPTEAQWEYACRAGTSTALNDGSD